MSHIYITNVSNCDRVTFGESFFIKRVVWACYTFFRFFFAIMNIFTKKKVFLNFVKCFILFVLNKKQL